MSRLCLAASLILGFFFPRYCPIRAALQTPSSRFVCLFPRRTKIDELNQRKEEELKALNSCIQKLQSDMAAASQVRPPSLPPYRGARSFQTPPCSPPFRPRPS